VASFCSHWQKKTGTTAYSNVMTREQLRELMRSLSNFFYLVLPVANIFHQLLAIAASHAGVRVPHPVVNQTHLTAR
jgi:hypothetical protein